MTPEYVTVSKRISLKKSLSHRIWIRCYFPICSCLIHGEHCLSCEVKHGAVKMFLGVSASAEEKESHNHLSAKSGQIVPVPNYAEMESKVDLN